MSECNHKYLTGARAHMSAVRSDGICDLCGNHVDSQPARESTVEPFVKMQPGEVDKVFQASCPKCDARIWTFAPIDDGTGAAVDPDVRVCKNCHYAHWLRGPNTSEVIPLPSAAGPSKKDRVRALVHLLIMCPDYKVFDDDGNSRIESWEEGLRNSPDLYKKRFNWASVVDVAIALDKRMEEIGIARGER